jgi:hypothetical protein
VLLDESTLLRDMKGLEFGREARGSSAHFFVSQRRGTSRSWRRTRRPSSCWETLLTAGRRLRVKWGSGCPWRRTEMECSKRCVFRDCGGRGVTLTCPQGEEVTQSHKVQSTRVVVEQAFADLKRAKVMTGNKIRTASQFGALLDCVIALHNFEVLRKANPNFELPPRRGAIPGEHIFTPLVPSNEVDLKIPADAPNLSLVDYRHIKQFKDLLPSAARAMRQATELGGKECVFYPTVGKRGQNLHKGAYVLQLRVQEEVLGVWTVRYLVGASYSYETHTGIFKMSPDDAVISSACDCFAGWVLRALCCVFARSNPSHLILAFFFFSARPCSHLYAVLLQLLDLNGSEDDMKLVRRGRNVCVV